MRFRTFSLRTGLILFLVLGAAMGLASRWYHEAHQSGRAQARLKAHSSLHTYQYPSRDKRAMTLYVQYPPLEAPSWWTKQARKWVHPDYNREFESARLGGNRIDRLDIARDFQRGAGVAKMQIDCKDISPAFAAAAFRARGLKSLSIRFQYPDFELAQSSLLQLRNAQSLESLDINTLLISQSVAHQISQLPTLHRLHLERSTPQLLMTISKSPKLESLHLGGFRSSAGDTPAIERSAAEIAAGSPPSMLQALSELACKPTLKSLRISGAIPLEPEEFAQFCRTCSIKSLDLHAPKIAHPYVSDMVKMPNLESLLLYDETLRDEHLTPLYEAKKLKKLMVGPNISKEGLAALRKKLPDCKVVRHIRTSFIF